MKRAWWAALAAWAIGCAPVPKPAADAGAPAAPESGNQDGVTLERGPCFGTCPVYSVTIARTGAIRFEGRRFVADSGLSTASVPRERVDSLLAELEAGGYFDLADSYRSGDAVCTRYATDLPTVITEVRSRGRVKRVEHDRGCADAPKALSDLEARIDEVAGVSRWIRR
jgi:hypothetical protein